MLHPYSTNSEERKNVPAVLAILALFTSFALSEVFHIIRWEPPLQVDVTSVLVVFGFYYWLFKKFCWRWDWLRSVGVVSTPILEGRWVGKVKTAYCQVAHNPNAHDVEVNIAQDWTEIVLRLKGPHSHSRSLSASMTVSQDETKLIYEYISEPNVDAVDGLQIHYGTARLALCENGDLEGEYYTGRGRFTIGSIVLHRVL